MTLKSLVDEKLYVTMILVAITVFFLQRYLTKKMVQKDGKVSHYVGNDSIGYQEV